MNTLKPIWVIAKNNYKEIIRDRILYGILIVGLLVTSSSFFLSSISLGQDHRVLQNIGLAAIHIFALFINIFLATNSLSKDFERRTLYLLFSKPISRVHYVLGKYVGLILLLLTTLFVLGGIFTLISLSVDRTVLPSILINLSYSFLEISLITALAILFATFTAPLNASLYTIALFIIGHSLPLLRDYAQRVGTPFLKAITTIIYYLLPNLEKFDIRQAVLYGLHIPSSQVAWTLFYWLVYTSLALGLAILVMKQREI